MFDTKYTCNVFTTLRSVPGLTHPPFFFSFPSSSYTLVCPGLESEWLAKIVIDGSPKTQPGAALSLKISGGEDEVWCTIPKYAVEGDNAEKITRHLNELEQKEAFKMLDQIKHETNARLLQQIRIAFLQSSTVQQLLSSSRSLFCIHLLVILFTALWSPMCSIDSSWWPLASFIPVSINIYSILVN